MPEPTTAVAEPLRGTRDAPPAGSDFASLLRTVRGQGLLERRRTWYALGIATNALALAGIVTGIVLTGDSWWSLLLAPLLAVFGARTAFIGHDAGHSQIAAGKSAARVIGLIHGNLLLGMSYAWWNDKHNRHHGNPNHQDLDPDIDVGVIAYSEEQALAKTGLSRWIVSHQAGLFFPLLFGLAWTMHVSSVRFLIGTRERLRWVEVATLVFHALAFPALLIVMVGPWRALLVIVVQKCVGGFYLASVFAPNHKGMPQIDRSQELDFMRSQVLTSRNVKSSPLTDLLYGSLNYQIEHHLFPTMPRCNVRRAHAIVRAYCAEVGVPYYETSIYRSYQEILSFLHEVGAPLRQKAVA